MALNQGIPLPGSSIWLDFTVSCTGELILSIYFAFKTGMFRFSSAEYGEHVETSS